jgi:hypothetical protein|tara:strand:- start:103 stop:351 length:249 start_codon:yes stop_codon:yes gene_type:complete
MKKHHNKYNIPIWLSDWTFKDKRGNKHTIEDVVVKGKNKGEIFLNKNTVNKVVKKLIGTRKKHTLKATNLVLKSQHGFGVEE